MAKHNRKVTHKTGAQMLWAMRVLLGLLSTPALAQNGRPAGPGVARKAAEPTMTQKRSMTAGPVQREPVWEAVPWVSRAMRQAGYRGGEGGQWARALAADGTGQFVLYGTDVGGLFRSRDGGVHWEACNVGYTPRGTAGLAIDPFNSNRCLSVGANSVASDFHGLYLSLNGAASWINVLKANIGGSDDRRDQIAYDRSSYDRKLGYTRVVYWSRIAEDKPHWGTPDVHPALYKSLDGGQTWNEIPNSEMVAGSIIRVHPRRGIVYAASEHGFGRSIDGGATFTLILKDGCQGIDVSAAAPDTVYLSQSGGVWRSTDAGQTFTKLAGAGLPTDKPLINVKVSPANANHLVLWANQGGYDWPRFYSTDGGATWGRSEIDNKEAFLPFNARQGLFAWHPRQGDVLWSVGGDWPTKSTDAGRTYRWSGEGDNGVLVGGKWNFCTQNPDVIFAGSQDYNGAVTTDGGATWRYANVSGNGWGGFTYGGYAASANLLFVGNAAGWGSPRELKVSRDGGTTWTATGLNFSGPDVSYGDPTDANVLFASNLRSDDGGLSWKPMTGCDAVYTSDAAGRRALYGSRLDKDAKQSTLVKSDDKGVTWTILGTLPGEIGDIALDHQRRRVYVANQGALKSWSNGVWTTMTNLPKDQWGGNRIASVAVDPANPAIVYATSSRDLFSTNVAVVRSLDAGATWQNLTLNTPLRGSLRDGGREAICVRVHPRTRAAYVSTSCYGIWKIGPVASIVPK